MTPLNEVTPPETLYHYTSQAGLIGILSSRRLWASKIHYLNDSREFALALDIARSELERRIEANGSKNDRKRLETLLHETETIAQVNICVACFSELGDSLSQWRGYCAGGSGYSIGFHAQTLLQYASKVNFSLYPCIYDGEQQRAIICDIVDSIMATDFNTTPGYIDSKWPRTFVALQVGGDFADRLAALAPIIKHHSFSDEKE